MHSHWINPEHFLKLTIPSQPFLPDIVISSFHSSLSQQPMRKEGSSQMLPINTGSVPSDTQIFSTIHVLSVDLEHVKDELTGTNTNHQV